VAYRLHNPTLVKFVSLGLALMWVGCAAPNSPAIVQSSTLSSGFDDESHSNGEDEDDLTEDTDVVPDVSIDPSLLKPATVKDFEGKWAVYDAGDGALSTRETLELREKAGLGVYIYREACRGNPKTKACRTDVPEVNVKALKASGLLIVKAANSNHYPYLDQNFFTDFKRVKAHIEQEFKNNPYIDAYGYNSEAGNDAPCAKDQPGCDLKRRSAAKGFLKVLSETVRAHQRLLICYVHPSLGMRGIDPETYGKFCDIIQPWNYRSYPKKDSGSFMIERSKEWAKGSKRPIYFIGDPGRGHLRYVNGVMCDEAAGMPEKLKNAGMKHYTVIHPRPFFLCAKDPKACKPQERRVSFTKKRKVTGNIPEYRGIDEEKRHQYAYPPASDAAETMHRSVKLFFCSLRKNYSDAEGECPLK
jgi:hypothetical protein